MLSSLYLYSWLGEYVCAYILSLKAPEVSYMKRLVTIRAYCHGGFNRIVSLVQPGLFKIHAYGLI